MDELWRCFQVGVAFPKESRSLLQYWIMWRRVAGGLTPERQLALYQALRIRLREAGPDLAEAFRLCGALERLPQNEKESLVRQVVANLLTAKTAEVDYLAWTLGRLLNREPLYASPHTALSRALVLESFAALTALNWGESHLVRLNWTFSRAARLTGDRARDLLSADQARISRKLESSGATAEQLKLLHQVVRESDEVRSSVWGEELPSGLSLSTT